EAIAGINGRRDFTPTLNILFPFWKLAKRSCPPIEPSTGEWTSTLVTAFNGQRESLKSPISACTLSGELIRSR
ncbi:hypothetical protein U1Q18_031659, partial [Sarracenia purpurea var. burkii]